MKKLFTAIQKNETATVKSLLLQAPESIFCVSKGSPKQYDGQSPLQVALKTGNTAIANYLLGMGADVNFIEDETCCNTWRTPVLHDAINCAVMSCRWNTDDKYTGSHIKHSFQNSECFNSSLFCRENPEACIFIICIPPA